MSGQDIVNLDRQEVGYDAIDVQVELIRSEGSSPPSTVTCRTYVQKESYQSENHLPSKLYKMVVVKGAHDNQLPVEYIEGVIQALPDNGRMDAGPANWKLE